METPVYEILYNDQESQLDSVSLVEKPAVDENFLAFTDTSYYSENEKFAVEDGYRQVVTGPALIPDKCILRYNKDKEPYYVYFPPETIRQLAMDFFSGGVKLNFSHTDRVLSNSTIIESWFSHGASDKSRALGYECPENTWFLSVYLPDKQFFEEYILSGELQGFSVEGKFAQVLDTAYNGQPASKAEDTVKKLADILKDV